MRLEDLDFDLPEGLVAQYPSSRRDESRLLAMARDGDRRRHLLFRQVRDVHRKNGICRKAFTQHLPDQFSCEFSRIGEIGIFIGGE